MPQTSRHICHGANHPRPLRRLGFPEDYATSQTRRTSDRVIGFIYARMDSPALPSRGRIGTRQTWTRERWLQHIRSRTRATWGLQFTGAGGPGSIFWASGDLHARVAEFGLHLNGRGQHIWPRNLAPTRIFGCQPTFWPPGTSEGPNTSHESGDRHNDRVYQTCESSRGQQGGPTRAYKEPVCINPRPRRSTGQRTL